MDCHASGTAGFLSPPQCALLTLRILTSGDRKPYLNAMDVCHFRDFLIESQSCTPLPQPSPATPGDRALALGFLSASQLCSSVPHSEYWGFVSLSLISAPLHLCAYRERSKPSSWRSGRCPCHWPSFQQRGLVHSGVGRRETPSSVVH